MNTSLLKKIVVATLIAGTFITAQAALKVGDALPDFSSFKLEGKVPDALKGKVILLDFWASWCGPCKESFPVMNELHKAYAGKGLVILAINEDEEASDMKDFLKDNKASFTVLRDLGQKLVATAGVSTMPGSFLIDTDGKVKFVHSGFHGAETKNQYMVEIESLLKK